MISITHVVSDIVLSSDVAIIGLKAGYLNLNAFARSIQKEVESKTKKQVRVGSIVVALSRLRQALKNQSPLIPNIVIDGLSVRSGLAEIVFNRTSDNLMRLRALYQKAKLRTSDILAVTQGTEEITIVAAEMAAPQIIRKFGRQKPKAFLRDLASLAVRFSEDYVMIPNVIYAIVRTLALKHINIIEVVSTYTEIIFIVREEDLQNGFITLNVMFRK